MVRLFTPYEKNQLNRYGLSHLQLPDSDVTPVEYLTSHVDFAGNTFIVNHHTLIPRIETQELIPIAIDLLKPNTTSSLIIAEVGCGSGALGISTSLELSKHHRKHHIYLSDLDPQALEIARTNSRQLLPPASQPSFITSDLLHNFPPLQFDLIMANLPYIPSPRMTHLDSSVFNYEPHHALDGGSNGSEIINRLLAQLPEFTHPKSLLLLEVDHTHRLTNFHLPPHLTARLLPDSLGHSRFLVGQFDI